ncbi:alpha/beta fold hydrolase [Streptosporangium sp. KLBMP 9127]|nr:alpha/beta hydrolase [Streptosporangium sp. KLBMP 9127]
MKIASVAGVGAMALGPAAEKEKVTTYLFVTGANGGTAGDAELALRGHRTVGVELPGHGPDTLQFRKAYQAPQDLKALAAEPSAMAGITLDDYVEAAVKAVRRAAKHGPVILVGGSMGGATITGAANEVPHLIDRLVYISAFCCTRLKSIDEYLATPEGKASKLGAIIGGLVGDPAKLGAVRVNWRSADPKFLAETKAALSADASDAEFMAMLNSSLPDDTLHVSGADSRGRKATWGRVPRTYIRHSQDMCIPVPLQDRMIADADALTPGNTFDVHTVRAAHAPSRASWAKIVDILDKLARS